LAAHGADVEARTAATSLMRYFDTAARQHHTDEEQNLFPALIESMAGSDAVGLRALTDRLTADHRELDRQWQRVRIALERVVVEDGVSLPAADVDALVGLYEQHIEREERDLLPMAARLLSDDALQQIGRAMRERRGIEPVA
jgi:hemerythrin-like domain-containing protein